MSLLDTIDKLINEGKLPKGITPNELNDQQWNIVEKEMRTAQEANFNRGERLGIKKGFTPEEQARSDKEDPNLKDPFRGRAEDKG